MCNGGFKTIACFVVMLLGLSAASAQAGNQTVADFIDSRQVVCTVQFDLGSSGLNAPARDSLDKVVNLLAGVNKNETVIRIEGFSSPDGVEQTNIDLSMARAQSVEVYLHEHHGLPMDRYLIGRGVCPEDGLSRNEQRRVEIAMYDNLLDIETAEVDKVVIDGKRDH